MASTFGSRLPGRWQRGRRRRGFDPPLGMLLAAAVRRLLQGREGRSLDLTEVPSRSMRRALVLWVPQSMPRNMGALFCWDERVIGPVFWGG